MGVGMLNGPSRPFCPTLVREALITMRMALAFGGRVGELSPLTWGGCGAEAPAGRAEWVFVGCVLAGFPSKAAEEASPSSSAARPKHAATGGR